MKTIGRKLLNFTLLVVLGPGLISFALEGARFLASVFTLEATKWFLFGAGLSLVACLFSLSGAPGFIEHLLHELEHATVAFFFSFKFPIRMEIDPSKGSKVVYTGGGGCLTTMAPYYFPLLTVPFLLIKALAALAFSLLKTSFPIVLAASLDLLVGTTLICHTIFTLKEVFTGPAGDDIDQVGAIPFAGAVLFLNLVILILSIAVVTASYAELLQYLKIAAGATVDAYQVTWEFTTTRILPALGDLEQWIRTQFLQNWTPTPAP